jgi:hypothetical protein
MSLAFQIVDALVHEPQAMLYYILAVDYALAFWAVRCGRHAPCLVYLSSCFVHLILGALHHLSHG